MKSRIKFLSICSGMEAASAAWNPLGWEAGAFSEIEPACCDLLARHHPDVPNLGDMTADDFVDRARKHGPYDLVCGGTPCQSFSIAGLRKGLNDDRGNLTLRFVEICNEVNPDWIVWENVRNVLSDETNAFGCLLAGLVGEATPLIAPGGKWTDAGYVAGPERTVAWRIFDAQYFRLAQRRRRVFVVGVRAGIGVHPGQVLFEPESMRRNSAPRREAGKEIAGALGRGAKGGGTNLDLDRSGAFIPERCPPVTTRPYADHLSKEGLLVPEIAHSLKSRYDGSEDGTGRGAPLVPEKVGTISPGAKPGAFNGQDIDKLIPVAAYGRNNCGGPIETSGALNSHGGPAGRLDFESETFLVGPKAYSVHGENSVAMKGPGSADVAFETEKARALDSRGGYAANQGGNVILEPTAFDTTQITSKDNVSNPKPGDPCHPLASGAHPPAVAFNHRQDPVCLLAGGMAVRRLTPRECERLMGFPDDNTLIKRKNGKLMADGPRYKMLGNSWAVPVVRWIGERIEKAICVMKESAA